jgi:formylglycine-generating enzyme required for sulfatase activity/serine/threonine protein kinase
MTDSFQSRSDLVSRHSAAPLQVLQPNHVVDRFTLQMFLGEGGMGSVWLAEDPKRKDDVRDGRVVLKFLRDDVRRCPEAVEQFKASYRKVQQLFHEHICPLLDLGDDPTFGAFQVMPFVKGMTLLELLKKEDPQKKGLPSERVVAILQPVAKALDYAHREGLIHRDIKPGNIMVDPETGKVFVVDFGLAAEVRSSMSMHSRSTMQVSGTEPYMAPEQWMGQAQDGRSDQYSLAVVAWQMLTGSLPYHGSGMQLGYAVTNGPIPELPDPLQFLQPVLTQALAKDRKQRFSSAVTFIDALARSREGEAPAEPLLARTTDVGRTASAADPSTSDDLVALLQKTQESMARKHAQAKQLLQDHRYSESAEILAGIPDHLRDAALFDEVSAKRDRVVELDESIRQAVNAVRLDGVHVKVTELLQLQPHRDDLQRLLAQLPAPVSGKSLAAGEPSGTRPPLLMAPFSAKEAVSAQEAWARHLGIGVEVTNGLGMKFRVIPPGTFDMGSPESELDRSDDENLHKVTITQPKLFGVYPVTQGEWTKVMGSNPSRFESVTGHDTSRFPVEQVNWDDCQEFLEQLNESHAMKGWRYRLPTEAEWEYACRAGTVTPFWFGSELNGKQANCDGSYPYPDGSAKGPYVERPSVVGNYGANPFGLYDQHGQVLEWCEDWYEAYDTSASQDPAGASSGSSRVLRGGSWSLLANRCRSAYRNVNGPSDRNYVVGFRVLCELS